MKKLISTILILFCLLPTQAFAKEIPVFNANGQKLPINPSAYTENDTTMLPVRAVAEYLNTQVDWQPNGQIAISKDDCQIFLTIGQNSAKKVQNGQTETITLTVAPQYKDDTTFVPLRFIAEALDTPLHYCVNSQDNIKYPAIFLGESKYAENYSFDDITFGQKITTANENNDLLKQMENELLYNGAYSLDELNMITSIFVGKIIGLYIETHNMPQSYGENSPAINKYSAFYISDEVIASPEWQQFLLLTNHQCRELSWSLLELSVTDNKITGTYGFELFAGFLFIPVLTEVEITLCDDSLIGLVPLISNPASTFDKPEIDANGHMWRITKISNPRAYINLQALRDNEPEMYKRWLIGNYIFSIY